MSNLADWTFLDAAYRRGLAADPKHLGARIGVTSVLHTWGRLHLRPLRNDAILDVTRSSTRPR
jgi:hypothetical protein